MSSTEIIVVMDILKAYNTSKHTDVIFLSTYMYAVLVKHAPFDVATCYTYTHC